MKILIALLLLFPNLSWGKDCIKGNCENGFGTLLSENVEYTGEFKDGKPHGKGIKKSFFFEKVTSTSEGYFEFGLLQGEGTRTYYNVDVQNEDYGNIESTYVGEFKNGYFHGWGTYTYKNGDKYTGEFRNMSRHGNGTLNFIDGTKYVGLFTNHISEDLVDVFLEKHNIEIAPIVKVPKDSIYIDCDRYWNLLDDLPNISRMDSLLFSYGVTDYQECSKLPPREDYYFTSTCDATCQEYMAEAAERKKFDERIDNIKNLEEYKQILSSLTYQFDNDLWYRKSSETCMGPSSHAGIVVSQIKNSYQQACKNISEGDTSFSNVCSMHIHIDIGVVEKVREWVDSCYEISDEEWEKEWEKDYEQKQKIKELEEKIDNQPKYKEVCRWKSGGSIYTYDSKGNRTSQSAPEVRTCRMVRIKSREELNREGFGWALGQIFD